MLDEVDETIDEAASSSQAAPDATAESSTAKTQADDKGANSSNAQGDKKPASMSEALNRVKLEEPPTTKKPASGEAPATENTESEEATDEEAGKTGEQPGEAAKADDSANDPFNKRPEWAELDKALGKDGAKKARPIIRQLLVREHQATEQVRQLKPVVDELRQHTGDESGFKAMQNIVRAYATDPAAAVPVLEQMLQDARTRSGQVVSSPDLKAQLAAIDKKVEDGEMDDESAKIARNAVAEVEKARAGAKSATAQVKKTEAQREQESRKAVELQRQNAINSWEENIQERDPDFGNVTPADDPKHGESVADRVFDALQLKFISNPNVTTDALIAEATRVYKLARGQLARPAAREQRPVLSNGSSTNARPKPRTMREAMDTVKLE